MRGIVKRFPGVTALSGVSLSLRAGEVLALVGENGAGKSALMKILGGACAPDDGQIFIDGAPLLARVGLSLPPTTPVSALTAGQRQMVEIARALSGSARILVMDERRITGVLPREGLTQQRIAALMTGSARSVEGGVAGDVEGAVTA